MRKEVIDYYTIKTARGIHDLNVYELPCVNNLENPLREILPKSYHALEQGEITEAEHRLMVQYLTDERETTAYFNGEDIPIPDYEKAFNKIGYTTTFYSKLVKGYYDKVKEYRIEPKIDPEKVGYTFSQ